MNRIIFFLLLIFCSTSLFAQKITPQVISSAGNQQVINSTLIEWTMGEVAITTLQGAANVITQGFHQSRYVITAIGELPVSLGTISVFPNPTSDHIQIKLTFKEPRSVYARIIDSAGKLVWDNELEGQQIEKTVSLMSYPAGSYFLHFSFNKGESTQTFKIQKIN